MLNFKQKKNPPLKGNRFLISVTVLGSAGPIRFVVNEEDLVAAVIETALKSYAREGRLPVLGCNLNNFMLYCPFSATEVHGRILGQLVSATSCCARSHKLRMPSRVRSHLQCLERQLEVGRHGSINLCPSRYLLIELN